VRFDIEMNSPYKRKR